MAPNGDSDRVAEKDREPALDTTDPMTAEQPSGVDSTGQGEQDATHCPRCHGRSSAGSPPAANTGLTYVMANANRCTVHPQHVMVYQGRDEQMYADRFACACGETKYGRNDEFQAQHQPT